MPEVAQPTQLCITPEVPALDPEEHPRKQPAAGEGAVGRPQESALLSEAQFPCGQVGK